MPPKMDPKRLKIQARKMVKKILQKCPQNGPKNGPPEPQKSHCANDFGTFWASVFRLIFQMPPKGLLSPKMNAKMNLQRAKITKKKRYT